MDKILNTSLGNQIVWLFLLAIPVACIAWTVTHEEVFSEWKNFCEGKCAKAKSIIQRKFFYLFTCEYCFSHYVTIAFLIITKYKLLFDDWRGYVIAGFSIVWIANLYMSIHAHLRTSLKKERTEIKLEEVEVELKKAEAMKQGLDGQ
jgi:hypothetical protein